MLSFHSDLNLKPCLWHGTDSQLWTSLIKSLIAMPCLLHRKPVCTHINPTHSPLLTPSKQHPFKLSRPILYLPFYSTLKRYKRNHDWDENKITLWLTTKIVSARTLGKSCEWDGGVNLCWRKPLIFINFIFCTYRKGLQPGTMSR